MPKTKKMLWHGLIAADRPGSARTKHAAERQAHWPGNADALHYMRGVQRGTPYHGSHPRRARLPGPQRMTSDTNWLHTALEVLSTEAGWRYAPQGPLACEPAALAALALAGHGRLDAARSACDWLLAQQGSDGSVGVYTGQTQPGWPTGWALLAWHAWQRGTASRHFQQAIDRAAAYLLAWEGKPLPRTPEMGHNTMLVGWPWVEHTHSWSEPTAINVLALRSVGQGRHARVQEGITLLIDRLLPRGGCNYGNTVVLGQELRPHVQPTGLVLLALARQPTADPRVAASLDWLHSAVHERLAAGPLAYALLGLAAHDRLPREWAAWLPGAAARVCARSWGRHVLALLALAALAERSPLVGVLEGSER